MCLLAARVGGISPHHFTTSASFVKEDRASEKPRHSLHPDSRACGLSQTAMGNRTRRVLEYHRTPYETSTRLLKVDYGLERVGSRLGGIMPETPWWCLDARWCRIDTHREIGLPYGTGCRVGLRTWDGFFLSPGRRPNGWTLASTQEVPYGKKGRYSGRGADKV
jgi:hypothetical protein